MITNTVKFIVLSDHENAKAKTVVSYEELFNICSLFLGITLSSREPCLRSVCFRDQVLVPTTP